jgi:hypothetical protein
MLHIHLKPTIIYKLHHKRYSKPGLFVWLPHIVSGIRDVQVNPLFYCQS